MKKFKIEVMFDNNDCLDGDVIQDFVEAETIEEVVDFAYDWLSENGVSLDEIDYIKATEIE